MHQIVVITQLCLLSVTKQLVLTNHSFEHVSRLVGTPYIVIIVITKIVIILMIKIALIMRVTTIMVIMIIITMIKVIVFHPIASSIIRKENSYRG